MKTRYWIVFWFVFSSIMVVQDAAYVLLRPASIEPGPLAHYFPTHNNVLAKVDHLFGRGAYDAKYGLTATLAAVGLLETVGSFLYIWLLLVKKEPSSALIGFASAFTCALKKIVYFLNEYFSDFAHIKHNTTQDIIFKYGVGNGLWLVVPAAIVWVLGREIWLRLSATPPPKAGKKRA